MCGVGLQGTRFAFEALRVLALAMTENDSLMHLDAEDARVTGDALLEFADMLRENNALSKLRRATTPRTTTLGPLIRPCLIYCLLDHNWSADLTLPEALGD